MFAHPVRQRQLFVKCQVIHHAALKRFAFGSIVYGMYVRSDGYSLKLEGLLLSERHIVLNGLIGIPVAVDVFRHPGAHTCGAIVKACLRNGIVSMGVTCIEYNIVVSLIVKSGISSIHTVCARLFQPWIVHIDVGRVAIIGRTKLVVNAGDRLR